MTTTLTTDASTEEEAPVLLAVSYLRVSTREQAERGGTEEHLASMHGNAGRGRGKRLHGDRVSQIGTLIFQMI